MSYDPSSTYIILNTNLGTSITDVNGNVYSYNSSFSNYTYTNSDSNINIFFNADSYANYMYITGVVLGNNFDITSFHKADQNSHKPGNQRPLNFSYQMRSRHWV